MLLTLVNTPAWAVDYLKQQREEERYLKKLEENCNHAREQMVAAAKQELMNECIMQMHKPLAYCQKDLDGFGVGHYHRPLLFSNIPECVEYDVAAKKAFEK